MVAPSTSLKINQGVGADWLAVVPRRNCATPQAFESHHRF
jgi:hypothetical protein